MTIDSDSITTDIKNTNQYINKKIGIKASTIFSIIIVVIGFGAIAYLLKDRTNYMLIFIGILSLTLVLIKIYTSIIAVKDNNSN